MGRLIILVSLIIVLAISLPLLIYSLVLSPGGINGNTASTTGLIELEKYSGWRGVESMVTPIDEYVKTVAGTTVSFSDLLWPYADSQNPFQDSVNKGVGVAVVTILSIKNVYRYSIHAYVAYDARIDKVIVKPVNTITVLPEQECIKDPELCESAKNQSRVIDSMISLINEADLLPALKGVGSPLGGSLVWGYILSCSPPGPGLRPITPIPSRGLGVMDCLHKSSTPEGLDSPFTH